MPDNIKIEKLSVNDRELWNSFVSSSPQGNLFNTFEWTEIFESFNGANTEIITAMKDGSITAGIMVFYKKKSGLKIITRMPLTAYTGLLFSPSAKGEKNQKTTEHYLELSDIILNYLENEYKFINISTSYNTLDARPFLWRGWKTTPQYTYIINLDEKEKIKNNFSSSLRRKINHCESLDFSISKTDETDKLISLQEESYLKSGLKPVMPAMSFKRLINLIKEKGLIDIHSISLEGNIHSMRAMLRWNNIVYDWIAGTSAEFKNSNATHYLLWKLLDTYSDSGFKYFDFMGANTKNIIDFKRSFGGEMKEYYDLTYYSSPLIKLLLKIDSIRKRSSRKQD